MASITRPIGLQSADQLRGCTLQCALHALNPSATPNTGFHHATHAALIDQAAAAEKLYASLYDWEIRILALSPGSFGDPLIAKLHLAAIAHDGNVILHQERLKTSYEALSYCWGQPVFDHSISCTVVQSRTTDDAQEVVQRLSWKDGVDYSITASLHSALQHIRLQDRTRYLWVDQLCINQHDIAERSSQVQKMLLIYRSAAKVLVWLGQEGQHTGLAMHVARNEHLLDLTKFDTNAKSTIPISTITAVKKHCCCGHYSAFIHGVQDLLMRPWYRRLWIKQEVWAARGIDMICGDSYVRMNELEKLSKELSDVVANHLNPFLGLQRSNQANSEAALNTKGFYGDDLLNTLQRTSSSECGDLRDRVYAVVGMVRATPSLLGRYERSKVANLPIDYSRTVSQVYQDAVKFHVERAGGFNIFIQLWGASRALDQTSIFGGEVDGTPIPSWCPNWNLTWNFLDYPMADEVDKAWRALRVGTKFAPKSRSAIDSAFAPDLLHLTGVRLARVAENSKPQEPNRGFRRIKFRLDTPHVTMFQKFKVWKDVDLYMPHGTEVRLNDVVVVVYASIAPIVLRDENGDGIFKFVTAALVAEVEDSSSAAIWGKIYRQLLSSDEDRLEWFNVK